MLKTVAILPLILLLIPGFYCATQLTARNPSIYTPLWAVLIGTTALNVWMMIKHKKRESHK